MDQSGGNQLRRIHFSLGICVLLIPFFSPAENLGGFSGSETRYGSNAREYALAGALVAETNIGFRQFSNPAQLAWIEKSEVGFSFFSMSLDRSIQTVTYSRHLPPKAGIGLSLYRSGVKNIIGRNTNREITETFSSSDILGMLTFGVQFSEKLSLGLNVKIQYSDLMEDVNSIGIGVDAGALYKYSEKLHIGLRGVNLFGKSKWKYNLPDGTERNYSIISPKLISTGCSYISPKSFKIMVQADFSLLPIVDNQSGSFESGIVRSESDEILWRIPDDEFTIRIGIEKEIRIFGVERVNRNNLTLRAGLIHTNPVLGLGTEFSIWGDKKLIWDYAVDPGMKGEGISHNFSWRIEI